VAAPAAEDAQREASKEAAAKPDSHEAGTADADEAKPEDTEAQPEEEPTTEPSKAEPVTVAPAPPADSGGYGIVRRDPEGIKGISPFWEAVLEGDRAYVARDYQRATARFRDALKIEPKNSDGHLRLGQALFRSVGKGNATEAERSWLEALSHAHNNPTAKSKALFLLADLSERKKAYEEATKRWNSYKEHALSLKAIKAYPTTADDRLRRIKDWQRLLVEYKAVRERIEKNAKEGAARERESAK
jgi:tetratricopeptide (TPR) repeat protein